MSRRCSIMILNYNGRHLLEEHLASVLDAVEYDGGGHEIVVVDNASTDNSVDLVKREFPSVRVIKRPSNEIMFAYNEAVREAANDYVLLLNNDVTVERSFLRPLLESLNDPDVFGTTPRVIEPKNFTVRRCGRMLRGFYMMSPDPNSPRRACPTIMFHGGAAAISKQKFLALGGFDPLYWPFYGEDNDLSYRAWLAGWKIMFEPASEVYHKGASTVQRVLTSQAAAVRVMEKTRYLFVWKNITDRKWLAQHLALILPRLVKVTLTGDLARLAGFFDALLKLPKAMEARKLAGKMRKRTDRQVLQALLEGVV